MKQNTITEPLNKVFIKFAIKLIRNRKTCKTCCCRPGFFGFIFFSRVQGWEAVCWGVLGSPLLGNRKLCRIYQISMSCVLFWSIWKSCPRFCWFYLTNLHPFPIHIFTFVDKKWGTHKCKKQQKKRNNAQNAWCVCFRVFLKTCSHI